MSNVPMYRNTNNIAFGVSVLIVLESLFTALCRDNEAPSRPPLLLTNVNNKWLFFLKASLSYGIQFI